MAKISDIMAEFEEKQIYDRLPDFRRKAADRYHNRADRERSMTAGLLLCFCMQKRGVSFEETPCFTEHGKMYFPDCERLYVNLTHGGDYAACVLASHDVGIDLEPVRAFRENVAGRICGKEELRRLMAEENEEEKNRYFTRLWTVKESVAKLSGEGIAMLLQSHRVRKGSKKSSEPAVYTRTYTPAPDYFLSVSSHEEEFPEQIILLSPKCLVQ